MQHLPRTPSICTSPAATLQTPARPSEGKRTAKRGGVGGCKEKKNP